MSDIEAQFLQRHLIGCLVGLAGLGWLLAGWLLSVVSKFVAFRVYRLSSPYMYKDSKTWFGEYLPIE